MNFAADAQRALSNDECGNGLDDQFKVLANDLVKVLRSFGLKTTAYSPGTPHFLALETKKKLEVLSHLRFYYELCQDQVQEGKSLRDSKTFTWRALKRCGYIPGSDFLGYITDGDIVEIYGDNNVQIFRNLEFFERCSYSLEDLYCCEWWRLYRRDHIVTNVLLECVGEIFSNEHPAGLHFPAPIHRLEEVFSSERFCVNMNVKFVGPLYTERKVRAIICIENAQFVE